MMEFIFDCCYVCVVAIVMLAALLARQNMNVNDSKGMISKFLLWLLEDSSKEKVIITALSA